MTGTKKNVQISEKNGIFLLEYTLKKKFNWKKTLFPVEVVAFSTLL